MTRDPVGRMARFSLRSKLLASVVLVLLPILFLLILGYERQLEQRQDEILKDHLSTAQAVGILVEATFDDAISVAHTIAADPRTQSLDPLVIDPYLQALVTVYPQYLTLSVFDRDGNNRGASRLQADGSRPGIGNRPYFQRMLQSQSAVLSDVHIGRISEEPVVVALAPIRGPNGEITGGMAVSLDLAALTDRLASVQLDPQEAIGLLDPTARVALYTANRNLSWEQRDLSQSELAQRALQAEEPLRVSSFTSPLIQGERMGAFASTPRYGWVVFVTVDKATALAPLQAELGLGLVALGIVAVVSAAIALSLAQLIVEPVRQLTAHAAALGRGELDHRVQINSGDELEQLGDAFNQMAAQIKQNLEVLRAVLDAVDSTVIMVDTSGQVRFVGRSAESMFGAGVRAKESKREEELIDVLAERLKDADDFRETLVWQQANPTETVRDEWELINHKILVRFSAPIYEGGTLLGRIEAYHDVTKERQAERLQREFLFLVSHEFRTPLTVVLGNLGLIVHRLRALNTADAKDLAHRVDKARAGARRLSAMVEELLDVSAIEVSRLELAREAISLPEFLADVVSLLPTIRPRLALQVPAEFTTILADRRRIAQVLLNLLTNAEKYAPPNSPITLRLERQGDEAVISVNDRGGSISQEEIPRLFDRFHRIRAAGIREGLGLGLYINHAIIRAHGGSMWVESDPASGTTFFFSLPIPG